MKIANDLDSVSCAFEYAEKFFASIKQENLEEVFFSTNIILDEIISNIVKYSKTEDDIDVTLSYKDLMIKLVIKDTGVPFNPLKSNIPLPVGKKIEDVTIGKLGITIVKKISEKIEYKRERDKNVLTIWVSTNKERGI